MKHKTNHGFIDEDGNWHCWKCTKENEFFYPKGKVVANFQIPEKNLTIRIVCTGEHSLEVEVWDIKDMKRIHKRCVDYLSSALREYERLIRRFLYQRGRSDRERPEPEDRTYRLILTPNNIEIPEISIGGEQITTFTSNTSSFTTTRSTLNEVLTYLEGFPNERIFYRRSLILDSETPKMFIDCLVDVPSRFIVFETDNSIQTTASFTFYNCRSREGKILYPRMPERVGEFIRAFMNLMNIHEISSSELSNLIISNINNIRRE